MPLNYSLLKKINDCLDMMSKRLDELEARRARNDALEDLDDEEGYDITNPLEAPQQPFSDSPPQRIHGLAEN